MHPETKRLMQLLLRRYQMAAKYMYNEDQYERYVTPLTKEVQAYIKAVDQGSYPSGRIE